jgi:predicted RNA-binding Zn ribbon-like protein
VPAVITIEPVPGKRQTDFQFDLTGGHLALDFANTVSRREDPERRAEHLTSYTDLLSFAAQDEVVSSREVSELRSAAGMNQRAADSTFHTAIALREAIYRVFTAIALEKTVPDDDVRYLSNAAAEAASHRRLLRDKRRYKWEWNAQDKNSLERVLWPIATAAVELLTSDELKRVRWCEAPDCQWLFLDHSRNRSRRWCDMTICGNRAKARRHYERLHS